MYIAILNWRDGENDPFTLFSLSLKNWFERLGRPAILINIDNQTLPTLQSIAAGISFAFTWQGLGGSIGRTDEKKTTFWDDHRIPLICYHGDHPCHMLNNHHASSSYLRHIYASPSFARFANQNIPRNAAATHIQSPVLFNNHVNDKFSGNYFVFPKNIDDTRITLDAWHNSSQKELAKLLFNGYEQISQELSKPIQKDHHIIINELLTTESIAVLKSELGDHSDSIIRLHVHALLDKVYRNILAEHTVQELKDVPLKIYGRGWDRFKAENNPNHEYLSFDKVTDNAFQFASNYGILDASPIHDNIHDRTLRAMGNQASFLSGSDWSHQELLGKDYSHLFFNTQQGALREKAEQVIANPNMHRESCREFTHQYHTHFSPYQFVKQIESLADAVK